MLHIHRLSIQVTCSDITDYGTKMPNHMSEENRKHVSIVHITIACLECSQVLQDCEFYLDK